MEMKMVKIEPGKFQMGSPENEAGRNETLHTVTLDKAFYIGMYEVTQEQYEKVMGTNPSYHKDCPKCPIESVTWYDCIVYCNQLSIKEKLTPCYYSDPGYTTVFDGEPPITSGTVYWDETADGFRLPTEAEWEYACRAGTKTKYHSGDSEEDLRQAAWFNQNSYDQTHDVGQKEANEWGLYDMHGNVFEWCWDWYDENFYQKPESSQPDPQGLLTGKYRVLRGGCCGNVARYCRSAYRDYDSPGYCFYFIGFRLARSPICS